METSQLHADAHRPVNRAVVLARVALWSSGLLAAVCFWEAWTPSRIFDL